MQQQAASAQAIDTRRAEVNDFICAGPWQSTTARQDLGMSARIVLITGPAGIDYFCCAIARKGWVKLGRRRMVDSMARVKLGFMWAQIKPGLTGNKAGDVPPKNNKYAALTLSGGFLSKPMP